MAWIRETVTPIALGDWTIEVRDDDLSVIRYRGADVLRSIRPVARDRNWATPQWRIGGIEELPNGIRMALRTTQLGSDLDASLTATASGAALEVVFEATSAIDFQTNRTGLVVLHPPQLAGTALRVVHASGGEERTAFPGDIAPHQPAFDIARLAWEHDGLAIECAFAGDVFEMEDQRNWTDASFKTYSRPLAEPFPYPIAAGETVRQAISVTAAPRRAAEAAAAADPAAAEALELADAGAMPAVSVGASTAPGDAPPADPIGTDLLVEVDLGWRGWPSALDRAARGGLPLDVRLVLPESGTEEAIAAAARAVARLEVARVTAFQPAGHEAQHVSDAAAIALLREALADAGADAPVIGGARSHFTELNREHHRLPADLDGVCFSATPMFHAVETLQVEESVAMQRLVAEQAVRIANGAPVHVGPVTLRTHVNNVATVAPPRPAGADVSEGYGPELLDADDERQSALELSAWVIASAVALSVPGVATLSYFEEWGPRGIRTADGDDLPAAEAVRALAPLAGLPLRTARSADGLVWALQAGGTTLATNISASTRTIEVGGATLALPPRTWRRV